jgi:hypothetical protein
LRSVFYRGSVFALALALSLSAIGQIQRSASEVRAFRSHNPCPATGMKRGACPGWAVDHIRPLCAGGEDHRGNMQWITEPDHRFKTLVDVKECRKLAKMANTPASTRPHTTPDHSRSGP